MADNTIAATAPGSMAVSDHHTCSCMYTLCDVYIFMKLSQDHTCTCNYLVCCCYTAMWKRKREVNHVMKIIFVIYGHHGTGGKEQNWLSTRARLLSHESQKFEQLGELKIFYLTYLALDKQTSKSQCSYLPCRWIDQAATLRMYHTCIHMHWCTNVGVYVRFDMVTSWYSTTNHGNWPTDTHFEKVSCTDVSSLHQHFCSHPSRLNMITITVITSVIMMCLISQHKIKDWRRGAPWLTPWVTAREVTDAHFNWWVTTVQ